MMLERVLYGCDVMPSAVHLSGATLAGVEPSVRYGKSRLYSAPYGRQQDGSVATGGLELLRSSALRTLFNTNDPALRTGSQGQETATQLTVEIPDEGFDLVIMNPPFTSNTKHYDADEGTTYAAFAAYGASAADQEEMAQRLGDLAEGTTYHGHAGLASAFAQIAHLKLRPGGVMALVLPFTAMNGASWAKFRRLIARSYVDTSIVSIAANGTGMAFSSDTEIAECLVIGRKREEHNRTGEQARATFTSLRRRPTSLAAAHNIARQLTDAKDVRGIEDGPYGGTAIKVGDQIEAETLTAPLPAEGGWSAARLKDASLAQTLYSLSQSSLWLPARSDPIPLGSAPLGDIGKRGVDSQMFVGKKHNGPFTKDAPSDTATYPALWNNDAPKQTKMICLPDSQLLVKRGAEHRANELWSTASRVHLNRDFTFGAQALAVAFTDSPSAGGRVWPNVTFSDEQWERAFTLWANSSLGLMLHWWHSSRQQSSKATMTIKMSESLPTLDLRLLSESQLARADFAFERMRDVELLPAAVADIDTERAQLDRFILCEILELDEGVYRDVRRLVAKWCAEPSVHGGKSRPPNLSLAL